MRFYSFFLAPLRNIGSVLYPGIPRQENPNENREFILVVDSPPPPPPPPPSGVRCSKYVGQDRVKEILKDRVMTSDSCFVISFDESLNDVTQKSEMDSLIRYWDTVDQEVKVRFWDAKFLGHATHQDLLATFNEATGSLNMSKMIQLSMDGPAVNVTLYDVLKNSRSDNQLPGLIDIGSCGLHVYMEDSKRGRKRQLGI